MACIGNFVRLLALLLLRVFSQAGLDPCVDFGGLLHQESGRKCCAASCGAHCGAASCELGPQGPEACCGRLIPDLRLCSSFQPAPCTLPEESLSLRPLGMRLLHANAIAKKASDPCMPFGGILHHASGDRCCAAACDRFCGAANCELGPGGATACCGRTIPENLHCGQFQKAPCSLVAVSPVSASGSHSECKSGATNKNPGCQAAEAVAAAGIGHCAKFHGIPVGQNGSKCCAAACGNLCGVADCGSGPLGPQACCGSAIPDGLVCGSTSPAPCTLRKLQVMDDEQRAHRADNVSRAALRLVLDGMIVPASFWQ
mmetsp:Transcript_31027/g.60899  ORF Transcript_31027/g.60899 Transcript_31027/m.60899 type:complete len:314 (+) Transcript_31027:2-943(+)